MKDKHVIIYLPDGKQAQYCSKDLGDTHIQVSETIECELTEVKVAYKEDDRVIGRSYVGMPYVLEMF